MASTAPTPSTSLDHPMLSCSTYSKNEVKYGYSATVIDLTAEAPPHNTMAHQPLRHMPHHQLPHSSAFHRVSGQPYDSHGPVRGCPYLQAQSSREPHHHSHYRPIHRVSNPSYCPSMASTVPLQHPPVNAVTPVIIDPEQLPSHVRTVPITSLPSHLLVNSVPMATPSFVQPPSSENPDHMNPSNHQHYHHHYHHHHHHHHHFVQPPYQVPQPPQPQPYHSHPYPANQMHHRHYRRWQSNNGSHQDWSPHMNHHQPPPTVHSASVQTYPDLLYHLLSVMSMQPAPAHPAPQPVWEEAYQQENYETLLNLAEQIGEAKPKGLTRAEIDQLPTFRVTAESKKKNEDGRCVVCLADFDEKQLVRTLPCSHDYHTRCIDKWLKSNRSCPICRTEVKVSGK